MARKHESGKDRRKKPKLTKEERRAKYTQLARDRSARAQRSRVTCFRCRSYGHGVEDCPQQEKNSNAPQQTCCFRCGSLDHRVSACSSLRGRRWQDVELPYAVCFVCKAKGHLASKCPENSKGIYVNGGSCKHCGGTDHTAAKCPAKEAEKTNKREQAAVPDADIDDLLENEPIVSKKKTVEAAKKVGNGTKTQRVVKF